MSASRELRSGWILREADTDPRLPDGYGGILHHRPSASSKSAQECLVPTGKYTRYWGNHIPLAPLPPLAGAGGRAAPEPLAYAGPPPVARADYF
jgi:hypothetical protein